MSRFKLLYFVIFIINLYKLNAQISDKRLCVDEECKVPISLAKTLLRYSSPDSRILSFAPNVDITIYSKSAGSREDLWGVEINGKRGYVPKHMVREIKVFQKPALLVNTEFTNDTDTKQVPSQVSPDKVQEPYEIVDGTTIYLNPQDDISPTSTDSPIQSTALPVAQVESNKVAEPNIDASEQAPLKDESSDQDAPKEQIENIAAAPDAPEQVQAAENEQQEVSEDTQEALPQVVNTENSQEQNSVGIENNEETTIDSENSDMVSVSDEDDMEDEDGEVDQDDDDDDEDEDEDNEVEAIPENQNPVTDSNDLGDGDKIEHEHKPDLVNGNQETLEPESKINGLSEDLAHKTDDFIAGVPSETTTEEETDKENENSDSDVPELETESIKEADTSDNLPPLKEDAVNSELVPDDEETETSTANVKETNSESLIVDEDLNLTDTQEAYEPKVEVTSIVPELEVPQPFDDNLMDVTPNPLEGLAEEAKVVKDTFPTLPPLGLFAAVTPDPVDSTVDNSTELMNEQTEEVLFEQTTSEEKNDDPIDKPSEENFTEEITSREADDVSFSEDIVSTSNEHVHDKEETVSESENSGFFSGLISMFGMGGSEESVANNVMEQEKLTSPQVADLMQDHMEGDHLISSLGSEQHCDATSCQKTDNETPVESDGMDLPNFNSDIFLYLVTTAVSVIIFLFGYIALDKSKREGPLVAKINNLEKELLIVVKENQILQEKVVTDSGYEANDRISNELVEKLTQDLAEMTNLKNALEEQVQSLEKELENSTEVGMELNRMLTEILSSEGGSDVLKANVEHLQRQLIEQQSTINSINETLAVTNTENHELRLELELSNKKVLDLQAELDKLLLNVLKIEEEKEAQQSSLEHEIMTHRQRYEETNNKLKLKEEEYKTEIKQIKGRLDQSERKLELKAKEFNLLSETVKQLKTLKNSDESVLRNLLENGGIKAELQLLKEENQKFSETLQQERELKLSYEKSAQTAADEVRLLKKKYDEADKSRVEMQTKLEVLSNYFKDREAQWQKEISKHESLWAERQGEATSTTERIKFMQEQLQNYKTQTESLKQEIMSQEIELKSQISVLEKKAHENWVSARQAERKLEETKQEAAQLRHRLTLRERAIQEDKSQHRLQSPIEQNGDMPVSPLESPASPPLLFGTRDHITKSPPIPGLPPFLPPPPGVPFMPPPMHGVPPFIPPPPPNMFPGDHRPPPLGRMSSPPLNSRYSPSSRGYSPYYRNSSSPSDSEYGTSPPHRSGYSPFNNRGEDRRDYKRPPTGRSNGRNIMKGGGSSGSGNSNESLEKINRQQSKV